MDHDEIVRLDGPWAPRTPSDVADLLVDDPRRWWIAGGWAIELATGVARPHDDIDVGIPRVDAALLRDHLLGRLDAWEADAGALRPFLPPCDEPAPT